MNKIIIIAAGTGVAHLGTILRRYDEEFLAKIADVTGSAIVYIFGIPVIIKLAEQLSIL